MNKGAIIMLLCITFENELLPFMLDMATEEECLKAIEEQLKELNHKKENNYLKKDDNYYMI